MLRAPWPAGPRSTGSAFQTFEEVSLTVGSLEVSAHEAPTTMELPALVFVNVMLFPGISISVLNLGNGRPCWACDHNRQKKSSKQFHYRASVSSLRSFPEGCQTEAQPGSPCVSVRLSLATCVKLRTEGHARFGAQRSTSRPQAVSACVLPASCCAKARR